MILWISLISVGRSLPSEYLGRRYRDTLPRDTLPRVSTVDLPVNFQQKRGVKCLKVRHFTPGHITPDVQPLWNTRYISLFLVVLSCVTTMSLPLDRVASVSYLYHVISSIDLPLARA